MRKRTAHKGSIIVPAGMTALATIQLGLACFAAIRGEYLLALLYLGGAAALLGWALSIRTAEHIAESRDDWKQSATDWQAIAEDRRNNTGWQ